MIFDHIAQFGRGASPMPIASLVRDHLLSAMAQGQADLDWSSVARVSARNAGLPG